MYEDDEEVDSPPGEFDERDRPDDVRGLTDTFSLRESPTSESSPELEGLASLASDEAVAAEDPPSHHQSIELPEFRIETDREGTPLHEEADTTVEATTPSVEEVATPVEEATPPGLTLATPEEDQAAHPEDYSLDGDWSDPVSEARERTQAGTRTPPSDEELSVLEALASDEEIPPSGETPSAETPSAPATEAPEEAASVSEEETPHETSPTETNPELLGLEALQDKRDRERDEVSRMDPEARLDAGLPTREEIQHERDMDPFRRVLHALGAGLAGAAGHSVEAYHDRAHDSRVERAQGLAQRLGLKAQDRSQQATRDQAAAHQAAQLALTRQGQIETNEDRDASRAITAGGLSQRIEHDRQVGDRADAVRAAHDAETHARSISTSPQSRSSQRILRAAISQLPQSYQDTFNAQLPEGGIEGLNAIEADGMMENLPNVSFRARPNGAGTGAGAARRPDLEAAARANGVNEETIRASTVPELATLVHSTGTTTATESRRDGGDGTHFTVAERAGGTPLQLSTSVYSDPVAQRQVVASLNGNRSIIRALQNIDAVRQRYSPLEIAIPGSAANGAMSQAQSRLATAQSGISNAGTINAGEREIYLGDGPPPWSAADIITGTDRSYQALLDSWNDTLRGNIEEIAENGGVSEADMADWISHYMRGFPSASSSSTRRPEPATPPRTTPATPPASDRVEVIRADGRRGTIPRGNMLPTDRLVQ